VNFVAVGAEGVFDELFEAAVFSIGGAVRFDEAWVVELFLVESKLWGRVRRIQGSV
jgi:hypothetical protein